MKSLVRRSEEEGTAWTAKNLDFSFQPKFVSSCLWTNSKAEQHGNTAGPLLGKPVT